MHRKTIALPGLHDLNIYPIRPIIDSELFQRLRYRKQLGTSHLIFPAAQHTRFGHALETYALTMERTAKWLEDSVITEQEAQNICLFALLHDIGHGPYSHAIEGVCTMNHKENGLAIIDNLKEEIEKCGGNIDAIKRLFSAKDAHAACVSHRPLGTDKLAYLKQDARYTTEAVAFRMGDIINHVYNWQGKLAINVKIVSEVMQLHREYISMHDRVYLRNGAIIAQHFFQKIVDYLLRDDTITEQHLFSLTDSELDALLINATYDPARIFFERLRHRKLPKTAIVLRADNVCSTERIHRKPIVVGYVPLDVMRTFQKYERRSEAKVLETDIARIIDIPPQTVLFIPVVGLERFIHADVPIYNNKKIIGTLEEYRPKHYEALQETIDAYSAVRVCVFEEFREAAAQPSTARAIHEYLMEVATHS